MSVLIERLCKKLKDECGIDCDPSTFQRIYAGRHQKSAGAGSWCLGELGTIIGMEPATECVRSDRYLSAHVSRMGGDTIVSAEKKE